MLFQRHNNRFSQNSPVIYLYGCHFFLQIFYLDNHYQVVPKRHTKLPRILDFDKRHINLMISACKKTRDGVTTYDACTIERPELVCYMRSIIERKPDSLLLKTQKGQWFHRSHARLDMSVIYRLKNH